MITRRTLDLDGVWELAEGQADDIPTSYPSTVAVPGLVDMATPGFPDVGLERGAREAFWYRRTFTVDNDLPDFARLRIGKARYGTKVFVNRVLVGEHRPNHSAATFDVRAHLQPGENELIIGLGAWRDPDDKPREIPDGRDPEAYLAVPGIYDSVQLILCGSPHIELVKTAPDIARGAVRVTARLRGGPEPTATTVRCTVSEADTGTARGEARSELVSVAAGDVVEVTIDVPIDAARLWTPEDPFLYSLLVETSGDVHVVRFGLRRFTFDRDANQALLNGEPYPLRGTSSVIFRFFEDPDRQDRPWRREWVRRLHEQWKAMHWNTVRYTIGFPPDFWYDIADEVGMLVIDEFPLFYIYLGDNQPVVDAATVAELGTADSELGLRHLAKPEPSTAPPKAPWPDVITAESLLQEFTEWVESRCNHPSVVVFNSNCESRTAETGKVIARMRQLDPQGRPWSDGWNPPQSESDPFGAHWYVQWNAVMRGETPGIGPLARARKTAIGYPLAGSVDEMRLQLRTPNKIFDGVPVNYGNNAVVLEEYGWVWLTRDGEPTRLTRPIYEAMTEWPTATAEERRYTQARILAAETEYFRCNRMFAGILQFCGLAGSHPRVFTADNFVDVESLEYEPQFWRYVRDAFSPAALMIDLWERELAGQVLHEIPVVAINDGPSEWRGRMVLQVIGPDGPAMTMSRTIRLPALGQLRVFFGLTSAIPDGDQQLVAELTDDEGYSVKSIRDITVVTRELAPPTWHQQGHSSAAGPHEA